MNDEAATQTLAPDDAFAALGDETRIEILQALAESDTPLSFSELRDAVGISDSGQLNYHLDIIEGHFVRKTDGQYELRRAGRRVIGAVLSGGITEDPVVEPTRIDQPCPICDSPTLVAFSEGRVEHYCPGCAGYYGRAHPSSEPATGDASNGAPEYGYLGSFSPGPAGTEGRSPEELFRAASTWGLLNLTKTAAGGCPECSAPLDKRPRVCEEHDSTGTHCEQCNNRHAVQVEFACTNCLYGGQAAFTIALMADVTVLTFLVTHGINPVAPSDPTAYSAALIDSDAEVLSTDPFEARFTLTLDDTALTVTVDDDLRVVETRQS